MLEARGDEDGDGAYDHGDLARQRSSEHRHPHGQTDQHVRQDTRCQRRERRLVQLRTHRSGSSVADRSCCVGSTSIPMRWAGQHSLPDLVLRSRVLGRGIWANTGIPFGRALSRRTISALCASVRELYRQASSARITGRALREDDARQERPLFHGPGPVRYEHSCCGHRLLRSRAFVLAQPGRDDRQLFQSQSSTPRPNPTIYSLTNIRERHAEVPCHRIFP